MWIVIPTWNRCDDLLECLASVEELDYSNKRVLVVDNGSTDKTVRSVREHFPQFSLLALSKNIGAAAASNAGFDHVLQCDADLILRLDSDTILSPDFLTQLVEAAQRHPNAGILVGKVYYHSDPKRIWSLGAMQKSWDLGAVELGRGKLDETDYEQEREIEYAWSAGMLLTKVALIKTKGFDTDFFVYYEEADLCARLRQLGLQIWSVPQAKMWHKVGQTTRSHWVAYQWNRSKMLFFRKHSRGLHKLSLIVYAYIYAFWNSLFNQTQNGNRGPIRATLSGLTSGLRHPLS